MSHATPAATVAIPTRGRPDYLEVALASIAPQARELGAELLVVSDGPDPQTAAVASRHGSQLVELPARSGLNAARNAAVQEARGELIVFVDDDVQARPGWLQALTEGADANPEYGVFGGPIHARLEGGPHGCGREQPPITALDLGPRDRDAEHVWGANMAIRRRTLEAVGPFDESITGRGDEEEWQRRYRAAGGRIRYLAGAALDHRRAPRDARLVPLSRAAYHLGRTARRNDVAKQAPPALRREMRDLAGAGWHAARRRCGYGLVFAAHSAGRIREALAPAPQAPAEDFLSGESGYVAGIRATATARLTDAAADAARLLQRRRLHRDAAQWGGSRRVLALAIERPDVPGLLDGATAELRRSRHRVEILRTTVGDRGKFENLNGLLAGVDPAGPGSPDWLLVLDDDVTLPRHFLDDFLFLAERFELAIAQPAHRRYSHAAWRVTRRHRGSAVRETALVEIGPVVAFHRRTLSTLLPFPDLRAGWGLDAHWAALAAERGWRIGVVDATAIEHVLRPVAASYDSSAAVAEARSFLAARPYVKAADANRTLVAHDVW